MAWGLVDAPGRHDRPIELEAADVHASKRPLALQRHQPDPEARTTLATKSYDFDEARLRSRNAALALEASHAAFDALMAERDRIAASRHHHSK